MFTHLHAHSWFSMGQGPSSPEALLAALPEEDSDGTPTLACTDTNGVYGAVEFQRAAEEVGVRPILGAHLVLGDEACVALAMDERGWGAICRAITAIHWRQSAPLSGLAALLAADRNGALILSSSPVFLDRLVRLSGPEEVYAELTPGPARHAVLAAAARLGIPPVVTNAAMFAAPGDWERHRLLRAISGNTTLSALPAESVSSREAWLKPRRELARHFPDVPEALDRAGELAERCRYRIPIGRRTVAPRHAEDAFRRLRELAFEGARQRYDYTIPYAVRLRLEHELDIIGKKDFADYFLVVHEIVRHARTHCGRGSVAHSIVSYCLGITHVDPLPSNLVFERFLNPDRKDPPDIDLDFPWDERDTILQWILHTSYPAPRAAMVANYNTFKLRGALREVAKVLGRPPAEIREVTRRVPWFSESTPLDRLLAEHPNFMGLDLPAGWIELARHAAPLIGTPRHLSLHPGGVVIVPDALTKYVPMEPAAKRLEGTPDRPVPVIQFDKDSTEDAGLVKIDILGNRSLAVIRDGIRMVQANTGRQLDYTSQEAGADPATQELFRTGRTMGVFYTESPASRLLCIKSRTAKFELLVLNTSIIRPASIRYVRLYLERLHGAPWQPIDSSLTATLGTTFGIMVYQEDVANVCAAFAGMSLTEADGVRKALSKKRPVKELAAYRREFFEGAARQGRSTAVTEEVWKMVMSFAGYSFCKGHSCSYIQVAQQSAYLRAHYPAEFFAAVLANGGGFYAPFAYVAEARRAGVTVRPPDVNLSEMNTGGRGAEIRLGFQFIKGLSAGAQARILAARSERPFENLADLRARAELRPDDLRLLIKVGALDGIARGATRPMMLWELDRHAGVSRQRAHGPELLANPPGSRTPPLPEYTAERRRDEELDLLDVSTERHPMSVHDAATRRLRTVSATDLHRYAGQYVLCAGMLTTAKPVHTAKDEPMQFATFDDGHGLIETVLFPDIHARRAHVLFDRGPFLFRGKVEEDFGAITVTVTELDRLERVLRRREEGGGKREAGMPSLPSSLLPLP
ncbi:MAG: DNA polymerase III subunit alpha [Gemmatimonadales bacterium]|nr:DNA polymerase III subunit alpha [Gemmatimonadales bacterium]